MSTFKRFSNVHFEDTVCMVARRAFTELYEMFRTGSCILQDLHIVAITQNHEQMNYRIMFTFTHNDEPLTGYTMWCPLEGFYKQPTIVVSRQNVLSPERLDIFDFRDKYVDPFAVELSTKHLEYGTMEDYKYVGISIEGTITTYTFECKKNDLWRTNIHFQVDDDKTILRISDDDGNEMSMYGMVELHGTLFEKSTDDEEISDNLRAKLDFADSWIIANEMDGENRFHAHSDRLTYSPESLRSLVHELLTDMERNDEA